MYIIARSSKALLLGSDMGAWPMYLADQHGDEELGINIVSLGDKLVFNENVFNYEPNL